MSNSNIIVVGGGMVGAAIALGLLKQGKNVTLLEQSAAPKMPDLCAPPDLRISALGLQAQQFLEEIGAWQYIQKLRLAAYNQLSVSEKLSKNICQKIAQTHFHAKSIQQNQLGYMVENNITQYGTWQALQPYLGTQLQIMDQCSNLTYLRNGKKHIEVEFNAANKHYKLNADLLIGADGANSVTRELAGIEVQRYHYSQSAMIIGVELANPAGEQTWQEFQPTGPVALLPSVSINGKHYATLIWYDAAATISHLQSLTNPELLTQVRAHFPQHTGTIIEVYNKASFVLVRRHAHQYFNHRVILAGDSAHTINPLAGQGVNLGFADAKLLLQILNQLPNHGADNAQLKNALQHYQNTRRRQNALMMHTMDLFYHGFSNNQPLLKIARNSALAIAERSGFLKQKVLRHAVGI